MKLKSYIQYILEQYSRRNCILIQEIAQNKEENTDQQAINFTNKNLDIKVNNTDNDRSYRIGRYDPNVTGSLVMRLGSQARPSA